MVQRGIIIILFCGPLANENLLNAQNLGNTCYINAVLQALLGLPNFMTDLTSSPSSFLPAKSSNDEVLEMDESFPLHSSLIAIAKAKLLKKSGADSAGTLKKVMDGLSGQFRGNLQQVSRD